MKTYLFLFLLLTALPFISAQETTNVTTSLEQLDMTLEKTLALPEKVETALRLVLGIKQTNPLNLSFFILVAALWIIVVLVTANALQLAPLFDKGTRWIGAIAIVTIGATTGVLELAARALMRAGNTVTFFAEWSSGLLITVLIILIGVIILLKTVIRPLKEHMQKIRAQNKGFIEGVREARRRMKEDVADEIKPVSKKLPDGSTITGPGL